MCGCLREFSNEFPGVIIQFKPQMDDDTEATTQKNHLERHG